MRLRFGLSLQWLMAMLRCWVMYRAPQVGEPNKCYHSVPQYIRVDSLFNNN